MIDLKQIKNRILVLNSTGTTLSAFKLVNVYNDSGTLKMRLANGDATVGSVYGATHLLLQTALNGESKYCTSFMVLDSVLGISGLTLGDVFLGPNGAMSSTPYTDEGDIDQCIGFAETTTKLFVNIALDVESYLAKALFSDINTGTDDNKYTTSKAIADSDIAFIGDIPVKASGAEINTGTDDDKFTTAKAIADSKVVLADKVITGDVLLGENTSIVYDSALSADGKYCGIVRSGTAGATLAFGDLVYLDPTDSRWEKTDANAASGADGDARGIIGHCVLAAASDGDPTKILLHGVIRADAKFPSFTVNAPVYVSEDAGLVVVAQPSTTDVVIRVLGFGLTENEYFFNPSSDFITHT